jgi:sulfatase maturation enzyme AslB (radical SAM superfamily)
MESTPFESLSRLHLIMGLQCNVRCTMCYQTDFSPKFNMPPELYKERLSEAYAHVSSVKLQGGEPTVMKNCKETAILLREHPNVKLTVITNGVLVDDFWHETFVAQGGNISVSINAATESAYDKIVVHGDYKRVVRNLERLLAARKGKSPTVGVTAVILKENFMELHSLIGLSEQMGLDYLELLVDPILSFAGLPSQADTLAEMGRCFEAKARSRVDVIGLDDFASKFVLPVAFQGPPPVTKPMCGAPFHNVVVDWDGDVRVCCNTWVKMGNLYKTPLANILRGRRVRAFRAKMKDGDYLWCSPNCPDNAAPTKLSLAHKYAYELRADPRNFVVKVRQKLQQVQGKWVKPRKRSKPLSDRLSDKKVRLPVLSADSDPPRA